jgi:energy-coupling factor transport system ATP-binding protein
MKLNNIFSIKDFKFQYPVSGSRIKINGELNIDEGDSVLLSGQSGSGKSTLLYALKGLIPETIYGKMSGEVLFRNRNMTGLSASEKSKIGFLFQNPDAQIITASVKDEIAFGMENLGLSPDTIFRRMEFYSKEFNVTGLLDRQTGTLSGGEKQKMALISILAMEPDVLLFDEPTAFLDPDSANHFVDTFHRLAKDKTIIIVEHNKKYLAQHITRHFIIGKSGDVTENRKFEFDDSLQKISGSASGGKRILDIEGLDFSYGKNVIFKDLNLELHEGEILGIYGANGSGKTTLLKMISKLVKPSRGTISYKGTDIKRIDRNNYYSNVALLFQNPENHFLFDNVLKEVSGEKGILIDCGLDGLDSRNPFTLSEGQKRRLSLAILWTKERDLYLLDEPTFGQDIESRQNLVIMIERMRSRGKTFIVVSHDIPFLTGISDRMAVCENGKLEVGKTR